MRGYLARRYWNRLAEIDALHAVDTRFSFRTPDLDRFWREGAAALDLLLDTAGAELRAGDAVVEIGCGLGRITRALAGRVASVRALDVSPRMLELAREHNRDLHNVDWVRGDGRSLAGIESASADAVVSAVVFQHIPDPADTLGYVREIGRVLRPGGWAAIQVSNDPSAHRRRARADGEPRGGLVAWHQRRHWRGSHVEVADVRSAAADGGMTVERVTGEGTLFCMIRLRRG